MTLRLKKIKFHCSKELINLIDVDIEKLLMSNKCVYGKKKKETDVDTSLDVKLLTKIRPLFIELLQMTGFLK